MFTSENHVGKLIELRVVTPFSKEEFDALQRTQLEHVAALPGGFVAVTDLRRAHVFTSEVADRFIALMGRANPLLRRSALLVNESAIFGMQAERAVLEAGNPARRAFRDPDLLAAWLGEVLTPSEGRRLRAFLAEVAPPASRPIAPIGVS